MTLLALLPEALKWAATGLTVAGAGTTAANLGPRITGWGFVVAAVGSACWIGAAQLEQDSQIGVTNLVMLALNLIGAWRWLRRGRGRDQ